jgi:hypothetical protein
VILDEARHVVPERGQVGAGVREDARGRALPLAEQAQQEVSAADVTVLQPDGLAQRRNPNEIRFTGWRSSAAGAALAILDA